MAQEKKSAKQTLIIDKSMLQSMNLPKTVNIIFINNICHNRIGILFLPRKDQKLENELVFISIIELKANVPTIPNNAPRRKNNLFP